MQLLKITTTPIEYKIQTNRAALKVNSSEPAKMDLQVTPAKLQIDSQNIKVKLDTSKARHSLGFRTSGQRATDSGHAGLEAAQQATAQYASIGNQMAQIQTKQDIPDIFSQRLYQQSTTQTVFLPVQGPDISWTPNSIQTNYEPASVHTEWSDAKLNMEYVPSKYQMDILQYPKVTIEYIGGPNYVPPSADPNYEE